MRVYYVIERSSIARSRKSSNYDDPELARRDLLFRISHMDEETRQLVESWDPADRERQVFLYDKVTKTTYSLTAVDVPDVEIEEL